VNREEAHMAAAKSMAQNAALKSQVRWLRKMLRQAYELISTDLDDEDYVEEWLAEYGKHMRIGNGIARAKELGL